MKALCSASFIYETLFDLAGKLERTEEINQLMGASGFWDDQEKAQELVGELSRLKLTIKPLEELQSGADDLDVLIEFAEDDDSGESENELRNTLAVLEKQLDAVELQAIMSSEEDACNAYVAVQAGEGGTDSSDWAEMLLRM